MEVHLGRDECSAALTVLDSFTRQVYIGAAYDRPFNVAPMPEIIQGGASARHGEKDDADQAETHSQRLDALDALVQRRLGERDRNQRVEGG